MQSLSIKSGLESYLIYQILGLHQIDVSGEYREDLLYCDIADGNPGKWHLEYCLARSGWRCDTL